MIIPTIDKNAKALVEERMRWCANTYGTDWRSEEKFLLEIKKAFKFIDDLKSMDLIERSYIDQFTQDCGFDVESQLGKVAIRTLRNLSNMAPSALIWEGKKKNETRIIPDELSE